MTKEPTQDRFDISDEELAAAEESFLSIAGTNGVNGDHPAPRQSGHDQWKPLLADAADIILVEIPPPVEIIKSLLCECSKFVIGSGSKAYKTWLTLDMALSISHGMPTLSLATERRRVLYVNLELKKPTFERRLQAVARAKGMLLESGWFIHLPLRGHYSLLLCQVIVNRLIAICKEHGITVVVIDPVAMLNTQGDENSSRDQIVLMNEIDRLTTEAGCTVILNDHFGKGNQSEKDPRDAIRGSSAKIGAIDAAMILRVHDVEDCYRADIIQRELPPVEPFVIGWKFPLMQVRTDLDPEAMKKTKGGKTKNFTPSELLLPIKNTTVESSITITAWSKLLGIPRTSLAGNLAELRQRDYIRTVGEGTTSRQYITEMGLTYLENEP